MCCAKAAEHAWQPVTHRETSTLILSYAAACMQAPLPPYNRPAMSSSTTQNSLPLDTQWLTLRTSRQWAAGPWMRCWSHWNIYRGVFCCFCAEWLKGGDLWGVLPPFPLTVSLASWLKKEVIGKLKEITTKKLELHVFKWTISSPWISVCVYVQFLGVNTCAVMVEVSRYW